MDFNAPVSQYMTKQVVSVSAEDSLETIKEVFDTMNIHHVPVVHLRKIEGIISKNDFNLFLRGVPTNAIDEMLEETRLKNFKARDIMTTRMAKVESTDKMNVVLEVFKINRFHALPVVDNSELVGIITTHDIITALIADDPVKAAF
jgi:CBS domain-containing protein